MSKNPTSIQVVEKGETKTVDDVATWWYDDGELIIELQSGKNERIPGGNVID